MKFNLDEFSEATAEAKFTAGDTVTIKLYDKDDVDVTPTSPDDVCTAVGDGSVFRWPYSNIAPAPTEYQSYLWTMTNQDSAEKTDVDVFGVFESVKSVFMIPFDVDVSTLAINKGDSFEPEIRVDTNSTDLNVGVEFSDGETSTSTTIYKATSDITDRGDGLPGGDDQVLLVAQGDTFQIFRIFLDGDETVLFDSRHVDMKITAETKDGKTQTIKKKIPFTQTAAIGFDSVP